MRRLELKIPPLILMVIFAIIMAVYDYIFPNTDNDGEYWQISAVVIIVGILICASAVFNFRNQKTTMHPVKLENASILVTNGIYNRSRNPMYLGFAIMLIGIFILYNNQIMIISPILFVIYLNIFQIAPEERAMKKLFGDQYNDYCNRVRRWV